MKLSRIVPINPFNNIATFERGTVFLLAPWSGPSVLALERLRRAWSAKGLPDCELHVIDLNEHSSECGLSELSGRVQGWGEAFHIRDGSITHFRPLARDRSRIDEEIEAFIRLLDG
jgi:hypothetical protein